MKQSLFILFGISIAGALTSCAGPQQSFTQNQAPGLYNLAGWNNSCDGYGYCSARVYNGQAMAFDLNGEIGHPFYVYGPSANCIPKPVTNPTWTANVYVSSGTLPPGLSFGSAFEITGIPTERGHWIAKVRLDNLYCNGNSYQGFEQELRFHISGSGQVVQ